MHLPRYGARRIGALTSGREGCRKQRRVVRVAYVHRATARIGVAISAVCNKASCLSSQSRWWCDRCAVVVRHAYSSKRMLIDGCYRIRCLRSHSPDACGMTDPGMLPSAPFSQGPAWPSEAGDCRQPLEDTQVNISLSKTVQDRDESRWTCPHELVHPGPDTMCCSTRQSQNPIRDSDTWVSSDREASW